MTAGANELGLKLQWRGEGVDEVGWLISDGLEITSPARPIVRVSPKYFRPTEVDTLLGDASKAEQKLGWKPRINFQQLVSEMILEDYKSAQRDQLVEKHGFSTYAFHE